MNHSCTTDKETHLKYICDILESNSINHIDLSSNNLNDNDLKWIIKSIKHNTKKCDYLDNIYSINLSFNTFNNNEIIHELFTLFGDKFTNLKLINLSNTGILSSLYNDNKLKSLNLSASITWYTYTSDDDDNDSDYIFQFEDDDDDDEDDEDSMDIINRMEHDLDDDESDDIIIDVDDNDYGENQFDDDLSRLQINYSVNMIPSNSSNIQINDI